jgi:hypothetical protein
MCTMSSSSLLNSQIGFRGYNTENEDYFQMSEIWLVEIENSLTTDQWESWDLVFILYSKFYKPRLTLHCENLKIIDINVLNVSLHCYESWKMSCHALRQAWNICRDLSVVEPKWCPPYFMRGILWQLSNMADKIVKSWYLCDIPFISTMLTLDLVFYLSFLDVVTKKLLKQNLAKFVVFFFVVPSENLLLFFLNLLDTCPNGACLRQNVSKVDCFNSLGKICTWGNALSPKH